MIAVWSVDWLGRSLQDLLGFLDELQAVGCDLYLYQQALDTSTVETIKKLKREKSTAVTTERER
jgi:DNA invertase Pin-like site-specific DNA recombinase